MTNTERAWYQDGWTVFFIVLVGGVFIVPVGTQLYQQWQYEQKPYVIPQISGRVQRQLFGQPELIISAWHQHPGDLRNGVFVVSLNHKEDERTKKENTRFHSFEIWKPNKENALEFTFPLSSGEVSKEIPMSFLLRAKNVKQHFSVDSWLINDWKSNQDE
ncbi:hypothetical protein [Thalassoglobus polymorphus]|uniref:Uncharacterized protein n=1 Tax=Thalassoglobus polymorphus TaxID=2527994 RepID=A0A517QK32_9PLAN|nr:hypothetical protein [Thalassoglobus polymorphus]QDT32006.1 hypothetical protein Mal48_12450 [Thalassoglobus polymorphus]